MDFECKRCEVRYVPADVDEVGVCDECFNMLEIEGYSLEEMFDRFPSHDREDEEDEQ